MLAVTCYVLMLSSCATYNQRIGSYYTGMANGDYHAASASLEKNKLLKAKRNRLLYLMEKGKLAHLMKFYDSSNYYFNEADLFMEDARTSAGDVALGTLLNPMMQSYKGEAFEKFMIHYYKALNYLSLNQPSEALVEARRISIQSYALQDKTNNNPNRYSDDAFSLMLQGLIYESNADINNAFISYRNAADIYLKNNNSWYGVDMPAQLKNDLLRTAYLNGFTAELERYERLFNQKYEPADAGAGGEVIVFWENGLAPVKKEANFIFALQKDRFGSFAFVDETGSFVIPFDFSIGVKEEDLKPNDLRSLRIAFPRYEEQPVFYSGASINANNRDYQLEKAENINALAFATLKERFIKDMSLALSRLAVKKLAEIAARPKEDAKNKNEKEALAFAIQVFTLASEKADTRNWQSLPHTIYYSRVPLSPGRNVLKFNASAAGKSAEPMDLAVEGNGSLQFRNLSSLR
ncbi:MAG: hypothetical protein EOO01_14605 [Chitinophagaceae bacterium]|nr:MAG: hypothetical protein EOO01_14605 [Chitinophagaceae bacterium]